MNGRTNVTGSTNAETTEVALDAPTNPVADSFDTKVELKWTDPLNKYAVPENGTATDPYPIIAQWHHTSIVRKENSDPTNINDGTLVTKSTVKNQYQSSGYFDTPLVNDTEYHYGLFAVTDRGIVSAPVIVTCTPTAGTPIRELTEGTVIKINENGNPVEFYVAKHNYQSDINGTGRDLILRRYVATELSFDYITTSNGVNYWDQSDIRQWLRSTYIQRFTQTARTMIGNTKIYYTTGNGNNTTIIDTVPAFILSVTELSSRSGQFGTLGELIPIYNTAKIARVEGGTAKDQWTRSAHTGYMTADYAWIIDTSGSPESETCRSVHSIVPAFTLPSAAAVNDNMELIEKVS